jgi:PAS domain S-box-containing protein
MIPKIVESALNVFIELTSHKRTQASLQLSEEKYRLVVENANEAIVVAQNGFIKFFNAKLMEFTGDYSAEELTSTPFTEFIHPEDRGMVIERHFKRLKSEACPQVYTFRIIDKGGKVSWVEINAIPISWEEMPAVLFFLNDITERKQAQDQLVASEQRYRQLVKHAPAGIYEVDFVNNRFVNVNDVMCQYSGYSRAEFLSLSPLDLLTEDSRQKFMARTARVLAGEAIPDTAEFQVVTKSGQLLWVLVNVNVTSKNGQPAGATVIAHNITERKQAQAELERYWSQLEELVQQRTAELTDLNLQLQAEVAERKEAVNRMRRTASRQTLLYQVLRAISTRLEPDAVARLTVDAIAEFAGWPHISFALPNKAGTHWEVRATAGVLASEVGLSCLIGQGVIGRVFRTARTQLVPDVRIDQDFSGQHPVLLSELAVPIKQGERVLAVLNLESDRPGTFGAEERQLAESLAEAIALALENARLFENAQQELAERKRAEATVKASLKEKEVLLQEIHHRVKNNLQVISSLLSLQAGYIEDRQVLGALDDSQHRIRSMALIHQKLYQSADLAQIDFGDYIQDLAGYLFRAQGGHTRNIELNIQTDVVHLNIDTAMPCGLILNELISNSLKHAFPNGRRGEIAVTCLCPAGDQIVLTVGDDGVGLPAGLDLQDTGTLGLELVKSLTEQLGGALQLNNIHGTEFSVAFLIKSNKDL